MITLSINLNEVEKHRLFEGKKGSYLNVALFETHDDKFGNDFIVKQSISKEEREKGVEGKVLGSGKNWIKK
jgi:hypothetical protein